MTRNMRKESLKEHIYAQICDLESEIEEVKPRRGFLNFFWSRMAGQNPKLKDYLALAEGQKIGRGSYAVEEVFLLKNLKRTYSRSQIEDIADSYLSENGYSRQHSFREFKVYKGSGKDKDILVLRTHIQNDFISVWLYKKE